jgi:hypothetical protein
VITSREAAEVARAHGLTLNDAAALSRLADSTEEAGELAALFAEQTPPDMNTILRAQVAARREHREGLFRRGGSE